MSPATPTPTCVIRVSSTCACLTCQQSHCPDCSLSFCTADELLLHFEERRIPGKHVCRAHSCGYCNLLFRHRSGLIQHYESGACRSRHTRQTIQATIRSLDHDHLITTPLLPAALLPAPPSLATERSWLDPTQRFKCYLCNPAKLGFLTLQALNQHLASPHHDAKSYTCRYDACDQLFTTIGGLVQHVESRSCRWMTYSDWWSLSGVLPGPRSGKESALLLTDEEMDAKRDRKYAAMVREHPLSGCTHLESNGKRTPASPSEGMPDVLQSGHTQESLSAGDRGILNALWEVLYGLFVAAGTLLLVAVFVLIVAVFFQAPTS